MTDHHEGIGLLPAELLVQVLTGLVTPAPRLVSRFWKNCHSSTVVSLSLLNCASDDSPLEREDRALTVKLASSFPAVQSVTVHALGYSDPSCLNHLVPRLHTLVLQPLCNTPPKQLSGLGAFTSLTRLNLSYRDYLRDPITDLSPFGEALAPLRCLLHFRLARMLDVGSLEPLTSCLTHLLSLELGPTSEQLSTLQVGRVQGRAIITTVIIIVVVVAVVIIMIIASGLCSQGASSRKHILKVYWRDH